jgi:predicted  nucleic acid-binding Zn-ribbon protein
MQKQKELKGKIDKAEAYLSQAEDKIIEAEFEIQGIKGNRKAKKAIIKTENELYNARSKLIDLNYKI